MHNSAGGTALPHTEAQNDGFGPIVSDLVSLIDRVQASIVTIEAAIARETAPGLQDFAANVIVLDDVTPGYVGANAALHACNARLGAAVQLLLSGKSSTRPCEIARSPARA
jgi:hypothetical protein